MAVLEKHLLLGISYCGFFCALTVLESLNQFHFTEDSFGLSFIILLATLPESECKVRHTVVTRWIYAIELPD